MKRLIHSSTALFLLSFLFLLTNCSKEKKLERSLHKKDGAWTISSVTWEQVIQDTSGQNIAIGSSANVGTFTFDKDGSGSYSFSINGSSYAQSFNWSVSGDVVSITKVSQTFDFSGNISQLAIAFSSTQTDKKSMILEGSETHQYVSGSISQSVIAGTFLLTKN